MTSKRSNVSAGLLLFRRTSPESFEVLIAHPGGPFWKRRDAGAWTIPKGLVEEGEDLLTAGRREFAEETGLRPAGPFTALGSVRQKAGKVVHAWACEGDADAAALTSNPACGRTARGRPAFPEIDRYAWCDPATAREKLNPAQAEFVERLARMLNAEC